MSFLIPEAFATTAATGAPAGLPHQGSQIMLVWLVVFAAFIYFFMWRPQAKRAKQHRDLITSLKQGDEVITNGGFMGKITKVDETFLVLQLAENTEVKLQRNAISGVLPKGTIK